MQINRTTILNFLTKYAIWAVVLVVIFLVLRSFILPAEANAATGKQTFETLCADCHEAVDFEDTTKAEIEAVTTGKVKHKKTFALTHSQIQDIVQYLTAK